MAGLSKRKLFGLVPTTNERSHLLTPSPGSWRRPGLPSVLFLVPTMLSEVWWMNKLLFFEIESWMESSNRKWRFPAARWFWVVSHQVTSKERSLITSVTLLMSNNFNQAIIIHLTCPSSPEDWHSYQDLSQNNQSHCHASMLLFAWRLT